MNPIKKIKNGYLVPNLAFVRWERGLRSAASAREIAKRIARDPESYLAAINDHNVPGIDDLRDATSALRHNAA
jgi:hypothetical protein